MTDSSWGDHGLLQTTLIKHPNLGGLPLRVRPEIAPLFQILIDELATKAKYWKDGKPRLVSDGGYNNRLVRGSKTVWSNHAWGNAVDLNAGENPMQSTLETSFVASEVTALANRLGMTWGGSYANRKDCLSGDTMVITREGNRRIEDLAGTDQEVLTRDLLTGESAWVKAPFAAFGPAPLRTVQVTRRNVTLSIRATDNHRWYLKNGEVVTTEHLKVGAVLPAVLYPIEPVSLDEAAIANGIVWGDGSLHNKHSKLQAAVRLYGDKLELAPFIEAHSESRWADGAYSRMDPKLKSVPSLDCSPEYAAGFVAGWFACDGHVDQGNKVPPSLSTSDPLALAWLLHWAPRLGITVTNVSTQPAGRSGFNSRKDNHQVSIRAIPDYLVLRAKHRNVWAEKGLFGWRVTSVSDATEIGETYCPTVTGYNTFCLATPSVPMLTGQSMHFEVTVSRPRAMRIIAGLNSAQDFDTIGLQRKLSAHGYAVGAIDGLYGAMTIAAVKAFQEAYGLPVNGLADATTLKTMEDALTKDQFAELLARITKLEERVQWGNEKGGGVNTGLGAESYGNAVRGSIVSAIADAVVAKLSTRGGV